MAGLAVQQKGTPAMETASSEKALLGMAEIFFFLLNSQYFKKMLDSGRRAMKMRRSDMKTERREIRKRCLKCLVFFRVLPRLK